MRPSVVSVDRRCGRGSKNSFLKLKLNLTFHFFESMTSQFYCSSGKLPQLDKDFFDSIRHTKKNLDLLLTLKSKMFLI